MLRQIYNVELFIIDYYYFYYRFLNRLNADEMLSSLLFQRIVQTENFVQLYHSEVSCMTG